MDVKRFLNDSFRVLECLCKNEVIIQGKKTVRLTQDEIAAELHLSKGKVNTLLKELIEDEYIRMASAGKYVIYKKGREVYDFINK